MQLTDLAGHRRSSRRCGYAHAVLYHTSRLAESTSSSSFIYSIALANLLIHCRRVRQRDKWNIVLQHELASRQELYCTGYCRAQWHYYPHMFSTVTTLDMTEAPSLVDSRNSQPHLQHDSRAGRGGRLGSTN